MPKEGDKVKIKTKQGEDEGILMPSEDPNTIVIKLGSGYNIGIDKKNVEGIKVVENYKERKAPKKETIQKDKNKPTITILHTGGTIASKVDYRTGGVISRFSPEEIIELFPEIRGIANIKSTLISNMFSEDMRFRHYSVMAKSIENAIKEGTDGIILTHGTDTLTYTSAALAFMLDNLPVPVILVGAQRSSDRGSTDATSNLICAAHFIVKTDFAEVAICMHESMSDESCLILPATKTRKLHSSRRDAFKPVNDTAIARVTIDGSINFIKKCYKKRSNSRLTIKDKIEEKVAILRSHPNLHDDQILAYKNYKGLIIEGFGLGQFPIAAINDEAKPNLKNEKAIRQIIKEGCTVCLTSQTIFGRVHSHVYSNAIDLENLGVIYSQDMLTETAFIKLAWLLANYPGKVEDLYLTNLKGELNPRVLPSEFLE